jgi:tectonin beta-propeller repeat-containing protein 1
VKLKSPDTEELVEKAIQDLSAGGTSMPGCEPGYIALWAVNFAGQVDIETTFLIIDHQPKDYHIQINCIVCTTFQVLYRQGINSVCPEGSDWVTVTLPEEVKAGQISVGPTGMVWMITWQGSLYLRTGISKFQPTGLKNSMLKRIILH